MFSKKKMLAGLVLAGLVTGSAAAYAQEYSRDTVTYNDWRRLDVTADTVYPDDPRFPDGVVLGWDGEYSLNPHQTALMSIEAPLHAAPGEHTVTVSSPKKITMVVRTDGNPTDAWEGEGLLVYESADGRTLNAVIDAELDLDMKSFSKTKFSEEGSLFMEGIAVNAQGGTVVSHPESRLYLKKKTQVDLENCLEAVHVANDNFWTNNVAGVGMQASDGGIYALVAEDTLDVHVHTGNENKNVMGMKMQATGAKTPGKKNLVDFRKDATFRTDVKKDGINYGIYARSVETDTELRNSTGTTLTIEGTKSGGHQMNGWTNYGLRLDASEGGTMDAGLEGALKVSMDSANDASCGVEFQSKKKSSVTGHVKEGLDVTARGHRTDAIGSGEDREQDDVQGLYFEAGGGSKIDFTVENTKAPATAGEKVYALKNVVEGASETGTYNLVLFSGFGDGAEKSDVHFAVKGDTLLKADADGEVGGIYGKTVEGAQSHLEFDRVDMEINGHKTDQPQPVKLVSASGGRTRLDIHKGLTLKTDAANFGPRAVIQAAVDNGSGSSEVNLDGENRIEFPGGNLFSASGEGAAIRVNGEGNAEQHLAGKVYAFKKAVVDINLDTAGSQGYLWTNTYRGTANEGTVNMTVKNGATWKAMGERPGSVSLLDVADGGVVDLTEFAENYPDQYHLAPSLEITELKGDGGIFRMETNIIKGQGQYVHIHDKSSGHHLVDVVDKSGAPGVDPYKPVKLFGTENGDTDPSAYTATFDALHPVELGPYEYLLGNADTVRKSGLTQDFADTDSTSWYLYAAEKKGKPKPTPAAEAGQLLASGGYLQGLVESQSLRQRLGDIRHFGLMDEGYTTWAKLVRASFSNGGDDLPAADTDITGTQFGLDRPVRSRTWKDGTDATVYAGLYGSYMTNKSTAGPSRVKGHYYGIGAYMSQDMGSDYFDLVARYGHNKADIDSRTLGGDSVKADGVGQDQLGISAELGRRLRWQDGGFYRVPASRQGNGFFVEPQAQLSFTRHGNASFTTDKGLHGSIGHYNSLVGRTGLLLEYQNGRKGSALSVYGKVMYNREFAANPQLVYNGTNTLENNYRGGYLTYGLGMDYSTGRYEIYTEVERSTKKAFQEKYRVDAGVRFRF